MRNPITIPNILADIPQWPPKPAPAIMPPTHKATIVALSFPIISGVS